MRALQELAVLMESGERGRDEQYADQPKMRNQRASSWVAAACAVSV